MLSSLAYAAIKSGLQSRAFRCGIELFTVNPAYSSVIGRVKFARIYTISVHQAAALVIARRHYQLSETLPRCWDNIPDNQGGRLRLPPLAKMVDKHVWSSWVRVQKNLQVALAERYQQALQARRRARMRRNTSDEFDELDDIPF